MAARRSPTFGLLAGLVVTLSAALVYAAYTVTQLRSLRRIQVENIDRNRADSLLLLRIQNNLNALGLTMRDMLDPGESYPLIAWRGQLRRIEVDLGDAMAREEKLSRATPDQRAYLSGSVAQFWDAVQRIFALVDQSQEEEARARIRLSLQARQEALSNAVARLLVQNNESEQLAEEQTQAIYARQERNAYMFLAAMLILIASTSLFLVQWNRAMFARVAASSEQRSELARRLISIQENTFRYISRELHDDFGQILTAIGAMLHRAGKTIPASDPSRADLRADLEEVRGIVQSTLDKIRTLSQVLHPMVLDDAGLEGALNLYLAGFEKQTGVRVHYEKDGGAQHLDRDVAIHVYRVAQEALNNVAKHSKSSEAEVRLRFLGGAMVLEVEDHGVGFGQRKERHGMGLTSMRERAELIHGTIEFLKHSGGGALVRLTVPTGENE